MNLTCVFGTNTNYAAVIVNSNTALCPIPESNVATSVIVYLQYQGMPWGGAAGLTFQYVNCGIATSCSTCLSYSQGGLSCG